MKKVIQRLDDAGYVAYLVGGCVRDFLLGIAPKDHDLVTDALPDALEAIFPEANTVGKQFGVLKVRGVEGEGGVADDGAEIEVATFREDLEYEDFRRPTGVRFAGPLEDAQRRDFTINALFYDPRTRKVLDCVDGVADLRAGRVRAIGDPQARFEEDALRLLRAIRFAVRFGFEIEERTKAAIQLHSRLIKKIAAERVRDELTLMLQGPRPERAFQAWKDYGFLPLLVPEAARANAKMLAFLGEETEPRSRSLMWAALLAEIGGEDPSRAIQSVCDRMRLSKDDQKRVGALVSDLPRFNDVFQMREATLQRWLREPYFEELLRLEKAFSRATDGNRMAYEFCRGLHAEMMRESAEGRSTKLLSGEDLVQLGFQPGPMFSEILRVVEDQVLERRIQTREEALEFVVKHFVG